MRLNNLALTVSSLAAVSIFVAVWQIRPGENRQPKFLSDQERLAASQHVPPDAKRPTQLANPKIRTSQPPRSGEQKAPPEPESASTEFREWINQNLDSLPTAQGVATLDTGKRLALAHRSALKELITKDPERALQEAVPWSLRQRLPDEITDLLAHPIKLRADFNVYATTPPRDSADPIRRLVETESRRYKAFVYGDRLRQPTTPGDFIVGIAIDNVMAVAETESSLQPYQQFRQELVAAEGGTGGPVYPLYPVLATAATGGHSILYLRIAFPDILREPQTEAAAYNMMRQVNDWFIESSFGKLFLLTTVAPLVVVPKSEGWYTDDPAQDGQYRLREDAYAVATAMGYDPDQFDHVILAYRGGPGNFLGEGNVGGKNVWLKSINVSTAAHELGHNFGAWHANLWKTTDFSVIGAGTHKEYDNHYDTMGEGNPVKGHFNAALKHQISWLEDPFIHDIRQSGTYRIYAFDQPTLTPSQRYALRVQKDERYYWGECRQKFGVSDPWSWDGILLNWSPWSQSNGGTHLLDTTPGSPLGRTDSALTIGRTFSDAQAGIHITPIAKIAGSNNAIDVVVNLGSFSGNATPTLSVSAALTTLGTGESTSFTATATDSDGDPLAYFWDFGDGSLSGTNSADATHAWNSDGRYVARCIVSDMKGGTTSDSVIVTVGSPSGFTVTGEVTDNGQPIADVHVHNGETGSGYRGTHSDSDGNYSLTNVPNGNLNLVAEITEYSLVSGFANPMDVTADISDADFSTIAGVTVSIVATDVDATEGSDNASFRISRTGPTNNPLKVLFGSTSGTADRGSAADYTLSPNPILNFSTFKTEFTIATNQSELNVDVIPRADGLLEAPVETATLTLAASTNYVFAGSNSATVFIHDADSTVAQVSIATIDSDASEAGENAIFRISRVGSTDAPLAVDFNVSGSATSGIDYASIGANVIIPIAETFVDLTIAPIDDSVIEGGEDVILDLAANASYMVDSTSSSARVHIVDDDIPLVEIVASDASASEAGQDSGTFTITRDGDTAQPLVVEYAISGSALHGVDYARLAGTVSIPAGSSSASINILPVDDSIGEPAQTAEIYLRSGTGYIVSENNYHASVSITDDDIPVVTVGVSDATFGEPGASGRFTLTTTGTGSGSITVHYSLTGSASAGVDFEALPGSVSIGKNSTKHITVIPIDDLDPEDLELITLTIEPDPAYTTFLDKHATLLLLDDDRPTVTVAATGSTPILENDDSIMNFHLSRRGSTASALTVHYALQGTAENGSDYLDLSSGLAWTGSVTIPANDADISLFAKMVTDSIPEGAESVILSILPDPSYVAGIASATHYILDNDPHPHQVGFSTSGGSGTEDVGTLMIPVTLNAASASPVTVDYLIGGGSATGGIDYELTAGVLAFDPGESTLDIPLNILDDIFDEPHQTIIVKLAHAWGAGLGTSEFIYTIIDNDEPPTPATLEITPAGSVAIAGTGGGPFAPSDTTYTLRNTGDSPLNWQVSSDASWLDLSIPNGTLAPAASTEVDVSLNVEADALLPQSYAATVSFTNLTSAYGDTSRVVVLNVQLGTPGLIAEPAFTGGDSNTITWTPLFGAEFFEVEHSSSSDFSENTVSSGPLAGSTTTHEITGLADGSTYYYRVRAQRTAASPPDGPWSAIEFSTQDANLPVLMVSAIPPITNQGTITINGTASDITTGIASVTVNGNLATTTDGFATWSATLTPLAPGNNDLQVVATNNADPANQAVSNHSVYYATSLLDLDNDGLPDDWEFANGLDLSDDGTGSAANGPLGDREPDGIVNLLEFAVNSDPNAHDVLPITTSAEFDPADGKTYFTVTYSHRSVAPGITIEIERTDDFITWAPIGPENAELVSSIPNPNGITDTVTLRLLPAIDDPAATRSVFVRMAVRVVPIP